VRRLGAVPGGQLDFELDDLIPNRIGAVTIRNSAEFAQPAACIPELVWEGLRLDALPFGWLCGLFFIHTDIIAQIVRTEPISRRWRAAQRRRCPFGVRPAGQRLRPEAAAVR